MRVSNVQVKNVDPELHEQLRARAAAAGVPLGEYVLELIRRDLRTPSRHDWLDRVRSLPSIGRDVDVAEALDEARAER
jgi:plasmid stability protein